MNLIIESEINVFESNKKEEMKEKNLFLLLPFSRVNMKDKLTILSYLLF
jgi:hypothetical protein